MPTRLKFVACAAASLGLFAMTTDGLAQDTKVRFVLDWKFEGQQAQFTVPAEDGTFKKYNLDVQLDRGAVSAGGRPWSSSL